MSSEQIIDQLKSHIGSLEQRLNALEGRMGKTSSAGAEGMRMILIGPPGAGTIPKDGPMAMTTGQTANPTFHRQGHPGAEDQGKVLRLPSGYR